MYDGIVVLILGFRFVMGCDETREELRVFVMFGWRGTTIRGKVRDSGWELNWFCWVEMEKRVRKRKRNMVVLQKPMISVRV